MKKILISAIALVFGVTAMNAQSPWFLGGELGFSNSKVPAEGETTKITSFNVNPQIGYMFNDNWGLILGLDFGTTKTKTEFATASTEVNSTYYGAGLAAIYKLQIVDKFFYAPTLGVSYTRFDENKVDGIGAGLNFLRFELRPSCNWGFNFNFGGLSFLSLIPKEGDAANSFGLNVGDAASVGFTYYF